MELELALKITRTRDDITSLSDLRISKDPHGPLFVSKETKTMFILIAHLKDYREDNIDIKINEDGSRIEIAGAKPVEEMVLKRWIMWNKKMKLRTFKKVFRIPDGVVLDKIKAKFNEEDSALTITMPKMVKGIVGVAIEDVKEEEVDRGTQETGDNIDPEPETTSKEAEQVVETKPEIVQTIAGEAPTEESDEAGTSATEDGLIEEESKEIGEVSDTKGESDATENVPQEVPERVGHIVKETTQEIEDQMEAKESIPEKVEPSASMAVKEPQSEEIPELKEDTPEAEKEVVGSELLVTGVEEPIKPEPDKEEQTENKEQVHEQEIDKSRNEIQESVDKVETDATENVPERVGRMVEEASQEIEDQMEVKESTPKKVEEPSASNALEPKEVQPKQETQEPEKKMPPTEQAENKEQVHEQETDQTSNKIQELIDKVESDAMEKVPERVGRIIEETSQEIEDQMEVKESTPEKVEQPSASIALEPKEVQPKQETPEREATMPPPVEQQQPQEIPELEEETTEAEKEVGGPELSVTGVQEHKTNEKSEIKSNVVKELEKQEAGVGVEEPIKPEPDQEEQADNEIQESVDKVEPDATENVPERVRQIVEETLKEIEDQMEVKESTPKKVEEPSASNTLEPKEVQPEQETQEPEATMPSPVEEPQPEKIPELKEEIPEAETEVVGSELSVTGVEEHITNGKSQIESNVVEELEKQQAGVHVEEPIKPEPDQEGQAENKEQVHEQETDQARNKIQESMDKVESNATENVPERVGQISEETSQQIEDQMEVKESTPEKVEQPSASVALEPKEVQPKQETPEHEATMPPPVEQQQPQEIPELEEETTEAEKEVGRPELSVTRVQELKTNEKSEIKSNVVEELEKQEAGVGVEEPIKPEPDQEEQADNEIQESVDKVEPDATENVPERVRQIVEETLQEIEDQMEVKESTPKKVEEPSASNTLEPKEVQPEQETLEPEATMPSPVEEPQPEEIPELKEETPEAEKEVLGSELSVTGVEEHITNGKSQIKSNVVEELKKQEAGVSVEEPIKPEPDQEEQAENKEQVHEQETGQARNKIQESMDKVESDATENVPERVGQIIEETSQEIENQMEVTESTPEKVEQPSASIALEPKEVQPKRETQEHETTVAPPVEEPQPQEIPELEEETTEEEKEVEGSELSVTGVEEHKTNEKIQIESNAVEELEKQEAAVGVEEPMKPDPDQEEQVENKEHAHELETDQARNEVQESVDKVESDATGNVPERVGQIVEETSKEIEDQMEVKESTPEKVEEPSVSIALEPKEVQPERETQEPETTMPPLVEEPQPQEMKEETSEAERGVVGSELSATRVEEYKTNEKCQIKINVVEELEKQEAGVGVEEPIKTEPHQEVQAENKEQVHELETDQARNEVQESMDKVESDATENVPEKVGQIVEDTSKEIEDQMEVKESTPEKVEEPSVSIALEPKEVQPERETREPETTMPPPVEEPQLQEMKEETPEAEKGVVGSELSGTRVEEYKTNEKCQIEINVVEELEKQEVGVGVEEPIKTEPHQEVQAENKEQVHELETDQARNEIQESLDKVESDATENVPEKVGQIVEETSQEIDNQMDVKESTPEKVEGLSASIALEPEQETQEPKTTMPPPVEEPQPEEIPELKEETPEAEKDVVGSELSVTGVEEHKTNEKNHIKSNVVEKIEKQEAAVGVEEPIKPEPDQEEQAENKKQVLEQETDQARNEIQELLDKVESNATENVPERVCQIVEETSPEIEDQMEVKESTAEKVDKPSASEALEPKEVQPERETQAEPKTTMPPPVEELQPEEIPELKEVTPEAEKEVVGSVSVTGVEEHKTNEISQIKSNVVEELEKQEAVVDVEEPIKPEPDQGEQAENKKQVHEQETDQARNEIQELLDKVESDAMENVPERVCLIVEETSPEIEDQMEVKESTPEKVEEPSASNALEPKEVQPERETQEPETTVPPPVEEPQPEEIPELKEETPEGEKEIAGSKLSVARVEEHKTNEKSQIESNVVEELEKQEADVGIEEPIKPEPDQEEQAANKEHVHEQETHQASNEIQESVDKARLTGEEERNERINPEVEQQIDGSEGPIQENKKKKKKPNLCPPLVVVGSATLVSLIVIVIRFIRSDHEQETVQTRNEIHESVDEARLTKEEERNENVNPELEKQMDRSEGPIQENEKPIQENEKQQNPDLCPSLVVAGSATLISLVVLVIGLIRSNKR